MTRRPKLLWLDTGLVNYVAGIREQLFCTDIVNDDWRGSVSEQVVGQELLSYDSTVSAIRCFWVSAKSSSSAEVDFVIVHKGQCVPVEIKSGANAHLRSLHSFMDNAPHDKAVRIWRKPLRIDRVKTQAGKEFTLYSVPFYYISRLYDILEMQP